MCQRPSSSVNADLPPLSVNQCFLRIRAAVDCRMTARNSLSMVRSSFRSWAMLATGLNFLGSSCWRTGVSDRR